MSHRTSSRFIAVLAAVVGIGFGVAPALKAAPAAEPSVKTALAWWPPQQNVWTPIGWKDHLFRFNVVYNGHILCPPAGKFAKAHVAKYQGQDFQVSFYPSADGSLPAMPREHRKVKLIDGGVGMQGWREGAEAPVLWTDFPRQEGVVLRQEIVGHIAGGGDVKAGDEPLYAWVRLSIQHVDPLHAPKKFSFAGQLSKLYYDQTGGAEDSLYLFARPEAAKLGTKLSAEPLDAGGGKPAGMDVRLPDGTIRLRVLPGGDAKITLAETAADSGIYNLRVELPAREGAHADVLLPMLPGKAEAIDAEAELGFDGALAEAEKYWAVKPATAARIHTPEKYINDAIARNIQLAHVVAERNPGNGEYTFLSGSYGYDVLWATPTSMVSHMFLDLLGYHESVVQHTKLFKPNQGTVRPPGPAYKLHPGYFSSPKTLTSIDWLTDHGAVLETVSRHALLTGDQQYIDEWIEPLLKGCEFVRDACAASGHGGAEGVMPPAVATDTTYATQAVWNQAWNHKGLATTVQLLKKINHPRAAEFEKVLADFRARFDQAFRSAVAKQPTWTDAQGKQHPVLPANLIPAAERHLYDDCFLLDTGPLVLPWAGLMEANDPLQVSFAEFFRSGPNVQLRGAQPSALDRAVLRHEISSCEPCYSWNIVNSWRTGDREKFLQGMYSLFCGAISTQTYVNSEHRNAMYGNVFVAPLMTWSLRQSVIDDQLTPGELHLLRLAPLAWVSSAEETSFENMPTEFGPVDLKWKLSQDGKTLDVQFKGIWRVRPARIVLYAPPVPGLTTLRVNGEAMQATGKTELPKF